MGVLETESKKQRHRANLKKLILSSVAIAGVLTVAAVAPNVLGAMTKLGLFPGKRQNEFINLSRQRLVRQGLLEYRGRTLRLTRRGRRTLEMLELRDFKMYRPRRWDRKWRVLIFDIPEKRRGMRDKIRRTLVSMGFSRLQDSVWVYPYDCEDVITLLKADFNIGRDLLYLIVDSIENDRYLRRAFNLAN